MKSEIKDLKGLWIGQVHIEGTLYKVDFNVRHPNTSFFTVYNEKKTVFEWQAKLLLNSLEDNTWKITLNDPSIPIENNRFTNLTLWSWVEDTIIIKLGDGEKLTLNKYVG